LAKKCTIFIIDDEDSIRAILSAQLQRLGFNVLTAADGVEAEEIYLIKKDEIDLVLLDIMMPRRGGRETFIVLKKINELVNVIIISGFSKNNEIQAILDMGAKDFVQKPFGLSEITKRIKSIMGLQCIES
jgi:two-component system, cell cycle sensor histidine kinase and response regulator CckA